MLLMPYPPVLSTPICTTAESYWTAWETAHQWKVATTAANKQIRFMSVSSVDLALCHGLKAGIISAGRSRCQQNSRLATDVFGPLRLGNALIPGMFATRSSASLSVSLQTCHTPMVNSHVHFPRRRDRHVS